MKVLLRRNVRNLGQIGDVVDVKAGYARNYLVPYKLAVQPTEGNLKRVEEEKAAYLQQLAQEREQIAARAQVVDGKEVTIAARANPEGHLYGSVGKAQIVAALAEAGAFVEEQDIVLDEAIRELDKYDVTIEFAEDITATVHVWVVPIREPGEELEPPAPAAESETAQSTEADTERSE
ncbi:MAG: 50S ribosomal protein L9 [Phycisphaerae bacterium]